MEMNLTMNKIFTAVLYNWIHVAIKYIKRKVKLDCSIWVEIFFIKINCFGNSETVLPGSLKRMNYFEQNSI